MLYYLLGLALLLVVISWIYRNYPFDMTQGGHTYEGDFGPYSGQEDNLGKYFQHFTYKVLWSSAQSSCWSFCCWVFETIAGIISGTIPSVRSILAVAAIAIATETKEFIRYNKPGTRAQQQQQQEFHKAGEENCDDDNNVQPRDRRRKNRKKQKKRIRRRVQRNQDHAAHGRERVDFEQEDDKQPSPVEELLRLDREIAMSAVRRIDLNVGNALGKNKTTTLH